MVAHETSAFHVVQVGEKGHVKPDNYLDSHAKFLVGVATKGGTFFMYFVWDRVMRAMVLSDRLSY